MKQLSRRKLFEFLAAILRRDESIVPPLPWASQKLWHAVLPFADHHKVTAALPGALKALGQWDEIPTDARELLWALNQLNLERNAALKAQGLDVLTALQGAGIRAVALKGLAYQLTGLYADDPGMRLMYDLDILVAGNEADRAQEYLIAQGYYPDPNPVVDEADHHHLLPLYPDPQVHGPSTVEVHIGLGQARHDHLVPPAPFLAASTDVVIDQLRVGVPCSTDMLDHAVAHSGLQMFQTTRRSLRLADIFDIARLWNLVKSEGRGLGDLRITAHRAAMGHMGACLLLAGTPEHELGRWAGSAKRYLAQVLLRLSIPANASLEAAIIHNALLIRQRPLQLAGKLLEVKRYQNLPQLLSGKR